MFICAVFIILLLYSVHLLVMHSRQLVIHLPHIILNIIQQTVVHMSPLYGVVYGVLVLVCLDLYAS
uniref:Uncharacterized protein n=1 Tax=Arion vulgaris TaxID=1028688 RepID=A0A0B7A5V8_9EUPU